MTWDIEVWHDTTMWNEGFDQAQEPYVVVRVNNEADTRFVSAAVDHHNKQMQALGRDGWDKYFEVRTHPSNPNTNLATMGMTQAVGFVQGAISKWEGI